MNVNRILFLIAGIVVACQSRDMNEDNASSEINQLAASAMPAIPIDSVAAEDFIDIRGVGDSAITADRAKPLALTDIIPLHDESDRNGNRVFKADFGVALDFLDKNRKIYQGDVSFINVESVVSTSCNFAGGDFNFVMNPANMQALFNRGFNLIGLANNHSQDCANGALQTAQAVEKEAGARNVLWHGVTKDPNSRGAKVTTFKIKGRDLKVAFASVYVAGGTCTNANCAGNIEQVIQSFKLAHVASADLKILSIHCLEFAGQQAPLIKLAQRFIKDFDGDIVFGAGPHRWFPVETIKKGEKTGVIFHSLGNFIHGGLSKQAKNFIGRVLLDKKTLKLKQVQAIPVFTFGAAAHFSQAASISDFPTRFEGGEGVRGELVRFTKVNDAAWRKGWESGQRAVQYLNDPAPVGGFANY